MPKFFKSDVKTYRVKQLISKKIIRQGEKGIIKGEKPMKNSEFDWVFFFFLNMASKHFYMSEFSTGFFFVQVYVVR